MAPSKGLDDPPPAAQELGVPLLWLTEAEPV
jgi:hypothetical protein